MTFHMWRGSSMRVILVLVLVVGVVVVGMVVAVLNLWVEVGKSADWWRKTKLLEANSVTDSYVPFAQKLLPPVCLGKSGIESWQPWEWIVPFIFRSFFHQKLASHQWSIEVPIITPGLLTVCKNPMAAPGPGLGREMALRRSWQEFAVVGQVGPRTCTWWRLMLLVSAGDGNPRWKGSLANFRIVTWLIGRAVPGTPKRHWDISVGITIFFCAWLCCPVLLSLGNSLANAKLCGGCGVVAWGKRC